MNHITAAEFNVMYPVGSKFIFTPYAKEPCMTCFPATDHYNEVQGKHSMVVIKFSTRPTLVMAVDCDGLKPWDKLK